MTTCARRSLRKPRSNKDAAVARTFNRWLASRRGDEDIAKPDRELATSLGLPPKPNQQRGGDRNPLNAFARVGKFFWQQVTRIQMNVGQAFLPVVGSENDRHEFHVLTASRTQERLSLPEHGEHLTELQREAASVKNTARSIRTRSGEGRRKSRALELADGRPDSNSGIGLALWA